MSAFDEYMKDFYTGETSIATPMMETPEPLFTGDSLSKDELKQRQYLQPIRDYMIERKGVDYKDIKDEKVVDDFVQHMRYFNANTISTANEARFVSKANENTKNKARRAYEIYDNLGHVFMNDGALGAADGVKDYIFAAAKDPTNYLGLVTGGIARAGAAGVTFAGKRAVKETVKRAYQEAYKSGASKSAAKKAGIEAGKIAAKRAVSKGATSEAADKAAGEVTRRVTLENRRALARKAAKAEQEKLFTSAGTKSLYATTAIDSTFAVLQDIQAQKTLLSAGAQEKYSVLQTGFSSLLGGVAGAAQLGFGKFRGVSNLEVDEDVALKGITNSIIEDVQPILDKQATKEAAEAMIASAKAWKEKAEAGKKQFGQIMPAELVKNMIFGDAWDGTPQTVGGIAKVMKANNLKITRKTTISDLMTNVVRNMDDDLLEEINDQIKGAGITFGDMSGNQVQLSQLLAGKISDAGATLNVASQLRRTLDTSIVAAQDAISDTMDSVVAKEAVKGELKRAESLRYGQSVWKRMLVSSPATTAVNVFGFGQFYIGQTMADILNSGLLGAKGLGQMYTNPKEATRTFQQMRAYTAIQGQKMRNLLDPYTTHDQYMKFLSKNKDIQKILFETYAGGVEATAKRYNINPDGSVVKATEAIANASAQITGVRIQDSFTKSQMFMTEMDKFLRLKKGKTLTEAMNDETIDIGEDVIQAAMDSTLKSVYAKDYTTNDQLLNSVAKLVEGVSNTPGFGFILPFGRFMNNVVASAYQWSPLAGFSVVKDFATRSARGGKQLTDQEAMGRWLVGSSALGLAAAYDQDRQRKGLGVFEVDAGGGTIVDAKNTFPFSIFLATGRAVNLAVKGQPVPRELSTEVLTQLAVGQVARDVQFGNDLLNAMDTIFNFDEGQRGASSDAFLKATGNVVAGVTRPLDVVNRLTGYVMGNDGAKDVRQAEGMNIFTQSATKYMDNILESFVDKTDAITGEQLRVATREGEVYDPAPLARIFGLTVKPSRTAVEKAYSMTDMFAWTASERTKIPEYDKVFNNFLAPILEREMQVLLDNNTFKNENVTNQRGMIKKRLREVKREVRDHIRTGHLGEEESRLSYAAKIEGKPKETKREAMKMAKEQFGIDGKVEDMNFRELGIILEYVEYLEEMYREAGKL
tara:strand:+ start:340 stop:3789 length:3450 start_codon:yes stop_codon:yes gene_type:complete